MAEIAGRPGNPAAWAEAEAAVAWAEAAVAWAEAAVAWAQAAVLGGDAPAGCADAEPSDQFAPLLDCLRRLDVCAMQADPTTRARIERELPALRDGLDALRDQCRALARRCEGLEALALARRGLERTREAERGKGEAS